MTHWWQPRNGSTVFSQRLRYDPAGQITEQEYQQGGQRKKQSYSYDVLNRLTGWALSGQFTGYQYDPIGNRESVQHSTQPTETYSYYPGTNRLWQTHQPDFSGGDTVHGYVYNANGAQTSHTLLYNSASESRILREEYLGYSFRGLNNRAYVHEAGKPWQDWRYRYSAGGEREQKRLYETNDGVVPAPDSTVYPWVYYLLGGNQQQLAVYHGQQMDSVQTDCGDVGKNRVYLYPWEYITYGAGSSGLLITRPTGKKGVQARRSPGLDACGARSERECDRPLRQCTVRRTDSRSRGRQRARGSLTRRPTRKRAPGTSEYGSTTHRGRFGSVDPLWEQFPSQSPYHYSYNNPLGIKDPSGMGGDSVLERPGDEATDNAGGGGVNLEGPWDGIGTLTSQSGGGSGSGSGAASAAGAGGGGGSMGGGGGAAGEGMAGMPSNATKDKDAGKANAQEPVNVDYPKSRFPQSGQHIEDAQAEGHPKELTLDRPRAPGRRGQSLNGHERVKGMDRDEYPPACTVEGGKGASVRAISPADNRGGGSYLRWKLNGYPDGTKFIINVID